MKPFVHRDVSQIGIYFDFDHEVKAYVKSFDGVKWTQTHKVFYIIDSWDNRQRLFTYFNDKGYFVDYNALRAVAVRKTVVKVVDEKPSKAVLYHGLPVELKSLMTRYIQFLRGKRLSESTVQTYGYFVLRFLDFAKGVAMEQWQTDTIRLYLEQVITKEAYSISSHRQCIGGLKYLTDLCGLASFDATLIQRPKKSKYLPMVLSKEEIIDIIQATKNLKHRAIIALIYSSGLRIGELLHLELRDLDMDRSQIFVRQGKGRKDRRVVMAEIMKPLLYNYIQTYKPVRYFVEGRAGEVYSDSSVRAFLRLSCKAAGIKKLVTPHTLRHSYATHMMENGVDLRYIQELLGHAKPETTMIYTHVAQKDLMKVRSPLDVAVESLTKNGKEEQKVLLSRNF
uniref:tyrosine-type recombinase/integrase n=1 Tax=Gelidibacter sp. TaxID=2018083 RepID=UPI00404A742B